MSWQPVYDFAAFIVTLGTIIAFGMRQARRQGIQDERLKALIGKVSDHESIITQHTAELAAGKGNFRVIDEKLQAIKDGQQEVKAGQKVITDILLHRASREE